MSDSPLFFLYFSDPSYFLFPITSVVNNICFGPHLEGPRAAARARPSGGSATDISAASEALVRVAPIIPQRYTTVLSASLPLWAAICMLISRSRKPKYPYAPLRSSSLWIPVLADPANESKWQ